MFAKQELENWKAIVCKKHLQAGERSIVLHDPPLSAPDVNVAADS